MRKGSRARFSVVALLLVLGTGAAGCKRRPTPAQLDEQQRDKVMQQLVQASLEYQMSQEEAGALPRGPVDAGELAPAPDAAR